MKNSKNQSIKVHNKNNRVLIVFSILSVILIGILMWVGFEIRDNEKSKEKISDMEYGVIYYYSSETPYSVKIKDALASILDEKKVDNKIKVDYQFYDVSNEKDLSFIKQYKDNNKNTYDSFKRVKELEEKMNNLPESLENRDEELSKLSFLYKQGLNIVKNVEQTDESREYYNSLVKEIVSFNTLSEQELKELLDLQKQPRLKIPLYNDGDGEEAPIMKVVYSNNLRKEVKLDKESITDEILNDKGKLKKYLLEKTWVVNFTNSDQFEQVEEKLKNGESFYLYLYGNSCPHCHKFNPVIEQIAKDYHVDVVSLDVFIQENSLGFDNLVRGKKYGLTEAKWVPTLVEIKSGKQTRTIGAMDWAVENPVAELGYDINPQVVIDFVSQK